ncbi:MAG: flavodoxin [Prolixibacteraceae bacterium]
MEKIAIFFGPLNGSVHRIATLVASKIGPEKVDLIHITDASAVDLEKYDRIIFGISTIGKDTWQQKFDNTDWSHFFPIVNTFNFTGKKIAIFGLGDHITYAYHFVDSMGLLGKTIKNLGGEIYGKVSTDGYTFQDSDAIVEGQFIGLPVDEDFESELTDERVTAWVNSLMKVF